MVKKHAEENQNKKSKKTTEAKRNVE